MLTSTNKEGYFVPFCVDEIDKTKYIHIEGCHKNGTTQHTPDTNYVSFSLLNRNALISVEISVIDVFYLDSQNIIQTVDYFSFISDTDLSLPIDYKQSVTCFVGFDKDVLSREYMQKHKFFNCFVVLRVTDSKNKHKYLVLDYCLGQTLGIRKHFYSDKKYNELVKRNKHPIVLDKYLKQFFYKETTE